MNPLHLFWICPLCAGIGVLVTCLMITAGRADDE